MHHATVKYKKGTTLPFKKGSLPDSHYNIVLDKKVSKVLGMEMKVWDFHRCLAHNSTLTRSVNP